MKLITEIKQNNKRIRLVSFDGQINFIKTESDLFLTEHIGMI